MTSAKPRRARRCAAAVAAGFLASTPSFAAGGAPAVGAGAIGMFGIQGFGAPPPQLGGTGLFAPRAGGFALPQAPSPPAIGTPRSVPPQSFPGLSNNPQSTGTQGGAPGNTR